ncbi:MAG: hypothetical protein ACPG40_02565 [Alphaproteobacteria bacterium]
MKRALLLVVLAILVTGCTRRVDPPDHLRLTVLRGPVPSETRLA